MATQIAQEEIEIYRNMSYDVVKDLCPSVGVVALPPSALNTAAVAYLSDPTYFTNGQRAVSIEKEIGGGDDIRKLTVCITWLYHSRLQEKNVVTYITRYGINGVKDINTVF